MDNTSNGSISPAVMVSASIIVSALILTGALFFVGADITKQLATVTISQGSVGQQQAAAQPSGGNANTQSPQPTQASSTKADLSAYTSAGQSEGNANAKATIVEFSDFQCPFCERFFGSAYPQIKANYIDTGKAKFIYRNMPLDVSCNKYMGGQLHPMACDAAVAGACAADQGKFWAYHDKVFQNQQSLSDDSLKQWAKDIGLDSTKFNTCFDSKADMSTIKSDIDAGQALNFQGTPSFLLVFHSSGGNEQKVKDAVSKLQTQFQGGDQYFWIVDDSNNSGQFGVAVVGAQAYSAFQSVLDAGTA